ncbi:MAG: hypothetical protein JWM62_706 [Frankiales bacterium]|jgi:hypothetical protein|nr:hypothetical protein [Frankiales bacterium]
MSRKTIVTALTGLVLLTGLGGPALADPVDADRENVCLRLDPEGGREGICVWLPPLPPLLP